jgi:hypothetical protein
VIRVFIGHAPSLAAVVAVAERERERGGDHKGHGPSQAGREWLWLLFRQGSTSVWPTMS